MKKSLLLILSIAFSCYLIAQDAEKSDDEKEKKSFLERISLTPTVGALHYFGDLRSTGVINAFFDPDENRLGYGIRANYSIFEYLSVSGGLMHGNLRATNNELKTTGAANEPRDLGIGVQFKTEVLEWTLPRFDLNLTRLIFKDENDFFNRFSLGAFASHGLIRFNSKVYALSDEDVNLIYFPDRGRTGDTWEAVSSVGSTASYIINDQFDVGLETSFKWIYNDKIDAWPSPGSKNDLLSFTAITFTYHLKPRKEVIKLNEKLTPIKTEEEVQPKVTEEKPREAQIKEEKVEETIVEETPEKKEEVKKELKRIGVFEYNNLPMENAALVIYDENGNPVDTIYTDGNGRFEFSVLQADNNYTIKPINFDGDSEDIIIYLTDNKGNRLNGRETENGDFIFTKEKKEQIKTPKDKSAVPSLDLYDGPGNFVSVAAFKSLKSAKIEAKSLMQDGESPIIVENRTGSWYIVAIDKFDTLEEALPVMKQARKDGYTRSWVLVKPE